MVKFEDEAPFVAEGTCPACRGRLVPRSGDGLDPRYAVSTDPYGECVPCRRGYRLHKPGPEQAWMGPLVLDTLYLDAILGPPPPGGESVTLTNMTGHAGPAAFKTLMGE